MANDSSTYRPRSSSAPPGSGPIPIAPIGYHITLRLADGRQLVRDASERRIFARTMHEQGEGRGLFAFQGADTHAHALTVGSRAQAGDLARYVEGSLRWQLRLEAPFEQARIRPLEDRRHLDNAVPYLFNQERHHGLELDPLYEASSLPDMLGLRVLGAATTALFRKTMPRITRAALLQYLGPEPAQLVDPRHLLDATLAASGLVRLGQDARSGAVRCAAIHALGGPTLQLAQLLGVDSSTVRRWRLIEPDAALVEAIKLQLRYRSTR
jgi:hypothetical protein